MASAKPYIGCKIWLISKAQNRYEGILYTIDKIDSTVVLAKVKCFGTEGRPTDRPSPPKSEIYEYITFRGSDIKDIALCEPAVYHHSSLVSDPAIIHSSSAISSNICSTLGPLSPMKMPAYNQLAASSLLNHQYASAIGPLLQDMHFRRGPMVEKAVQTIQMENSRPVRGLASSQEQQWDRRQLQRPRYDTYQNQRDVYVKMRSGPAFATSKQETLHQNIENRPPPRRRQGTRRRRSHGRGQLMMNSVPSPVLQFDTDFDFDSSNAQFIKEELEREKMSTRDGSHELHRNTKEGMHVSAEDDHLGPKRYYDKSKSFFDNIPSDNGLRLTWAEERKRNLETFGVPGRFFRGQSIRGGLGGRREQGSSQTSTNTRGSAQQFQGQEEFYGEQYGDIQSSCGPSNQQYYADDNAHSDRPAREETRAPPQSHHLFKNISQGEYSYLLSLRGEQGYEASQHYYDGASTCLGNLQYSQQHSQFQQGSGQEQYSSQKATVGNLRDMTRHFVDHRRVKLVAGSGGKGACSFHSEPRKEWGGPDGGNGGDGGSIIIKADRVVRSLAQVVPVYKGENGEAGGSKNCYGRNGKPTYISVPLGTVVKELGKTVADLAVHGQEFLAAFGGTGGKGNRFFLSNENRAPMTATSGMDGQERVLQLELRTMAHAGLIGFPNAGKSSLLRAISNARPAVAAYPFTTLNPHVGIITYRDHEQVAVADIPGIIRGAHLNRGLGISFLRHIERCRFLLFVLDLSAPEPWTQLQHLCYELDRYDPGLSQRPQAVIANKMDLPEAREKLEILRNTVNQRVIPVSALTGQNTEELILHLRELYDGNGFGKPNKKPLSSKW